MLYLPENLVSFGVDTELSERCVCLKYSASAVDCCKAFDQDIGH